MKATLSVERIVSKINPEKHGINVEIVPRTGSTNLDLLAKVPSLTTPTLLLAIEQTAGRGRNGHTWYASPGSSLTFSLAWKFSRPAYEIAGIPLVSGIAIATTLRQYDVPVLLKWPNDILKEHKKLAGILVELPHKAFKNWAVIGVGINLILPRELEDRISQPAADMPWLAQMDHNLLMAKIIEQLSEHLSILDQSGFDSFVPRWNTLHAFQGQDVVIVQSDRIHWQGKVTGIDRLGRLLLETGQGQVAVTAGDVSLRLKKE